MPTITKKTILDQYHKMMDVAHTNFSSEQIDQIEDISNLIWNLYQKDHLKTLDKLHNALSVAQMLIELRMGTETICASLLYYSIRNSMIPINQIKKSFKDYQYLSVIVNGLTKADLTKKKYNKSPRSLKHSKNFRYLFLAICPDIRVVIIEIVRQWIKLQVAVKNHSAAAVKTAQESLWVFAPLAGRLGFEALKWRLQDLSLKELKPQAYEHIYNLLHKNQIPRRKYVNKLIQHAKQVLEPLHLKNMRIFGRPKHIYSIYHKITVRHKNFHEIYDFLAIRIIVQKVSSCYAVLSSLTSKTHWKPVPHRFKDYIMNPKANSYKSLHTTVKDTNQRTLEIQIRTAEMDRVDEYGIAAHWAYKRGIKGKVKANSDNEQLNSFKMMISNRTGDHPTYNLRSNLFNNHVFVFTPNHDIVALPKGAVPLDFAYRIHSEVGNHTIGAKVNGNIVSKDYQLNNGDDVSILTSPTSSGPSRDWLALVKSKNAERKIRSFLRRKNRKLDLETGKQQVWHRINMMADQNIDNDELLKIAKKRRYDNLDDFYVAIGNGNLSLEGVVEALSRDAKAHAPVKMPEKSASSTDNETATQHQNGVVVAHSDNFLFKISHCCYPVPGDPVIGYITRHQGIAVHRIDCPKLAEQRAQAPQQIIKAHWASQSSHNADYLSKLNIKAVGYPELLNNVLHTAQTSNGSVVSLSNHVENHVVVIDLQVRIANLKDLKTLMTNLRGVKNVQNVERAFD